MTNTIHHNPGSHQKISRPPAGSPFCEETLSPKDTGHLSDLINAICGRIERDWSGAGFQASQLRVRTVLEEAVCNAWVHGNGKTPLTPIIVRWHRDDEFVLEVIDQGPGFDVTQVPDPTTSENITKSTGRGIHIIRYFARDIQWATPGNHVRIKMDKDFAFDF